MTKTAKKRGSPHGQPVVRMIPKPPVDLIEEEIIDGEPSEDEIEDSNKLEELRSRFGGRQYTVRVERYNDDTSEMEIVDRFAFDTFDPFVLAKKYGGGRFVCTLFNDKSKYVEGGRFHYNFAKPKDEHGRPANPLADPMMQMFIQKMEANQAMMMKVFETAITGRPQQPIQELVAALKGMQDLSPKQEKENPLKMLKEVLEIKNILKDSDEGDGDEKGGMSGVMADLLKAAQVLMETKKLPPPGPGAQPPIGPRKLPANSLGGLPVLRVVDPPPQKEASVVTSPAVAKILFYVPQFVEAGQNNEDPSKWAGILLDILEVQVVPLLVKQYQGLIDEDGIWELLLKAAESEERVNKIFEAAPALDPYREWVVKVIQAAVKDFDGHDDPEPMNGLDTTANGDIVK